MKALIPLEVIERRILLIRGQKVMLSTHLAELYDVETRVLNQAVKRNISRFPEDFMFQLTREEADFLPRSRSQFAILKRGKNIKYLPYAFTEHSAIMAANVLNSPQAVRIGVSPEQRQRGFCFSPNDSRLTIKKMRLDEVSERENK
jgi:hypothetical protein